MQSRNALRTILPPLSIAETGFGGMGLNNDRTDIGESECDIDSIKKLKLGLKSTLWSTPVNQKNNPSSDYSIAV